MKIKDLMDQDGLMSGGKWVPLDPARPTRKTRGCSCAHAIQDYQKGRW
jgi:hypothetical protein